MHHFRTRWFRLALALGLVLVVTFGAARSARAVEFDDDGIIAADEVIDDDVFISSDTVVVDGIVTGNLFGSGGSVTINGLVNGDLAVAGADAVVNGLVKGNLAFIGRSLSLNGVVEGSVFFLGSSLTLGPSAEVRRNVFFNGFGMETEPGSTIGRDVLASGYQALLAGRVDQDVQAQVAALELEGRVGRNVMAEVSEPSSDSSPRFWWPGMPAMVDPGLRVAEEAQIGGKLVYDSPVEQADAIKATPGGGVIYQPSEEPAAGVDFRGRARHWLLARVRDLVTLLVLGGLAVWRIPALLDRLADQAWASPLPAAGWGLVMVIVGYAGPAVLAVLILILGILLGVVTLGGLAGIAFGVGFSGLALAFALFLLAVAYGSKLIVAYLAGKLALQRFAPQYADSGVWPMVLGVVLYILIRSIPLLGWLVGVAVMFVGLGAMWLLFREWRRTPTPAQVG
jgi:hypothetical protein